MRRNYMECRASSRAERGGDGNRGGCFAKSVCRPRKNKSHFCLFGFDSGLLDDGGFFKGRLIRMGKWESVLSLNKALTFTIPNIAALRNRFPVVFSDIYDIICQAVKMTD